MGTTNLPKLYQISLLGKQVLKREDTPKEMLSLLYFMSSSLRTIDEIQAYYLAQNAFEAWKRAAAFGYVELSPTCRKHAEWL
jgi:hypothetical protein